MVVQNFKLVGDGIALEWAGHYLDLHNCYDFVCLHYMLATKQVELVWKKSTQPWAATSSLPGLRLIFKDVSFFHIKERDGSYPQTDDECLASVSFHPVEARDEFDTICVSSTSTDDLTFFFESEWGIKLNAETVELVVLSP